jgi:hypothetical protein
VESQRHDAHATDVVRPTGNFRGGQYDEGAQSNRCRGIEGRGRDDIRGPPAGGSIIAGTKGTGCSCSHSHSMELTEITMTRIHLDIVGQLLMTQVRDRSIEDWERILDGRMKGQTAERVRRELTGTGDEALELLSRTVPRVVDTVLYHVLRTLEHDQTLKLSVEVDGKFTPCVSEVSDGLSGELYGERGWIRKFSQKKPEDA